MHGGMKILLWLSIGVAVVSLGVSSVAVAQQGSIQEAEELNQQILDLYKQGRYEEAIPLANQALAIREKANGADHPNMATALNNLAALYQATRDFAKAEPLLQRALAFREKVNGADHPNTATALNNLATLYKATGTYTKAEPLYQRALEIFEKVNGPDHLNTAATLSNLVALYQATGAYAKAEPLLQRALAIREKVNGADHPNTATALNKLAQLYQDTGAYAKAEPLYQRALAIFEKVNGPEHLDTAMALNNLATLHQALGAFAKAEPLLQRALTICEKVSGPDHLYTAKALNNLAALYQAMGAYIKAEPLLQRALAIKEKSLGPEHLDTGTSLNNLAMLYRATGAYAKAEPMYQRALAIYEKVKGFEHPDTATLSDNLAVLYEHMGAYSKAVPLHQRALAIYEKVLGAEHPDTAASLDNLASVYQHMEAYSKAESMYQRALAIYEKVLGLEHPNTATLSDNLAALYENMGAYSKALPLHQRALEIYEKVLGPEHPDTATSINNLAILRWAMGDEVAALPLFEQSHIIHGKNAERFLLTGSESRKRAYYQILHEHTSNSVSVSLAFSSKRATRLGLASVLLAKGRVLDAMADSRGRLRHSMKAEHQALLDELTVVARELSTLTHQGTENLQPEVSRRRREELSSQQERLETELSKESAEFREQVAPVSLAAVQAAVPKGAALIEWYRYVPYDPKTKDRQSRWGQPRYVAYLLRSTGEPAAVDIGDAEAIERLIHYFKTGLGDSTSTYVQEVAKELYEKLMKPLQPHLGNVKHLLLSPDGVLNLVPFVALRDEKGMYLGSKVEITYLTSGRDLVRHQTLSLGKDNDAVIVADPNYGNANAEIAKAEPSDLGKRSVDMDRGGLRFTPLPGTAEEAKILRTLLKVTDDRVLTQTKATEDRFKELHSLRILHVATHGFFLKDNEIPAAALKPVNFSQDQVAAPVGENPLLRSGLALAGANLRRSGEREDGILTAAEVAQMDLRGTQLVVLSACETGVGDVQNGEGVYGLRRALVLAGTESQVTSLWKVADEATKDLMVDYYQRLLKGEGRSEALRNAQLAMMQSKDRSHPYYWAAFVPIGDWRPLANTH